MFIGLVTGLLVFPANAAPPLRDMYLRARERQRQGSEIRQVESAVRFLWLHRKITFSSDANTQLTQLACSIRRALPEARGGEFLRTVSETIAREIGRSESVSEIFLTLTLPHLCKRPAAVQNTVKPLSIIYLDRAGAVVSSNPVWNACVRGKGITAALIKSNVDRTLHRSGRLRTEIPWSCRDYHKGPIDVWTHPDFPDISIVLDEHGKLISALPVGYLAVKGDSILEAKDR